MTVRIAGEIGKQMQQRRHRDVVRQVGDKGRRLVLQVVRLQLEHVAMQHAEPVDLAVRVLGDGVRQLPREQRIDFHGGDPRAAIKQRQCQ